MGLRWEDTNHTQASLKLGSKPVAFVSQWGLIDENFGKFAVDMLDVLGRIHYCDTMEEAKAFAESIYALEGRDE